uniref:HMA domain-containing protein n=1 Tax=Chenopodium quinoa TaxID=63459 RepID=A0A803KV31_CHEQI
MKAFDVDYESATEATEVIRSDQSAVLFPQTSLGFMESLTMPDVQEVVISADVRCSDCQKRILDMISRFDETESVVVNLSEKKVAITCASLKVDANVTRYMQTCSLEND